MEHIFARPPGIPRLRVKTSFDAEKRPTLTQQHMAAACDINNIVAKYQRTGAIDHFAKHGASYGFVPAVDFHEAMEIVRHGNQVFADLPSSLRERFGHDPAAFLEFVQNPDNKAEMAALGLVRQETAPTVAAPPVEGSREPEPPVEGSREPENG